MIIFHDPRCLEYSIPGHPERPERIARTAPLLKDRHPDWEWREPGVAPESALLRAHSTDHLRAIKLVAHDFDAHHGNGTEAIVAYNPRIAFASIHQLPAYPGTGAKSFANIDNYPVGPRTPRAQHVDVAERALQNLLKFNPDLLLVSAGFDAYSGDPLVQMTLEQEDFANFGEWLNKIDIPTAAILEGGYSDVLPELIDALLSAWNG